MTSDAERGQAWLAEQLAVDAAALGRLRRFVEALRLENARQNLVAASSFNEVWWRHVVDSAQLLCVPRGTAAPEGTWLDLGTGAGFPGLVVASLQPDRRVVLIDERRQRAEWLRRVSAELGLTRVEVHGAAVERVEVFPAVVISARAFAPLRKLLQLAGPFSTPETLWLLPKGAKARQEVDQLPQQLRGMFHVEPSVTSAGAGIVVGRGMIPRSAGVRRC